MPKKGFAGVRVGLADVEQMVDAAMDHRASHFGDSPHLRCACGLVFEYEREWKTHVMLRALRLAGVEVSFG